MALPDPSTDPRPPEVRSIGLTQPLRWLALGARDLARAPLPGLSHGLTLALFGALLFVLGQRHFWLLAGAFSGFLLVAPVLATGLYAVSRALERGEPATPAAMMGVAIRAWWPRGARARHLMRFGALLALAGTGWVLTSASLVTWFAPAAVNNPADFLQQVVLAETGWLFEGWVLLGGVLAAPVFASSVVAIPLLLDRPVGVLGAVLTSWRVVLANPLPMALWALLIAVLTGLGLATLLLGLVPVVPWLAHASWHAYRDCVVPET
ncbi:MAG: DUF2189 domain-containing protein [Burkholderiaceae bacterium]|nr:DUF2189 domain-containing protein [Burkholderiaceae bacterium]